MAKTVLVDVRSVTMQQMIDARLNGFAVDLLVESYARYDNPPPITLVWRGVEISLKPYAGKPEAEPDQETPAPTTFDEADCEVVREVERGGQHVGVSSAITIRHRPSGISVTVDDRRSQLQNKRDAIAKLRDLASTLSERDALRARLKLVDTACHSHHAASLVTWEDICPVCAEYGGVEFYAENQRLYQPGPP